ncbi:hypothetical protein K439DRAFT_1074760 [Ramaria rubella]|nr:hypothetical protein K439DRAFT_1074760 [Ramaria rubella]
MAQGPKRTQSQARIDDLSDSEQDSGHTTSKSKDQPLYRKKSRFEERYNVPQCTLEQVLEQQQKAWTSDVYAHFKMPVEIKIVGDCIKYVFICKLKPSKSITRSHLNDSTSNLVAHNSFAPYEATSVSTIKSFVHGSTYTYGQMRYLLVLWVAHHHRPYAIVHDEELLDIL